MLELLYRYNDKFVSKWLILAIDIIIVGCAFAVSIGMRYGLAFTYFSPELFKYHLLTLILVKFVFFFLFKTYIGVVRHTSLKDAAQILFALLFSTVTLSFLNLFNFTNYSAFFSIPYNILLIDFFVSFVLLVGSRFFIKTIYRYLISSIKSEKKVVIFGAGNLGKMTLNALQTTQKIKYKVPFFIDDNPHLIGKSIEGIKILSKKDGIAYLTDSKLENIEVIFAIQDISAIRKQEITEEFLEKSIPMRIVPPVERWIKGQLNPSQISNIRIEDLLERTPITVNNRLVDDFIKGKRIMVTGAAGSIGSEIVRQVINFKPAHIIIVDQAESPLYDLESELTRLIGGKRLITRLSFEIKNITNLSKMDLLFKKYKPQVVFHAAAYKHVPLMESNPYKAVEVNSLGTVTVADLSVKHNVEKFVFISTDKAVNPTNVMGATKRLAEIYVQSLNAHHSTETRFVTTRFGNVLGSNGSVIPLFRKQIEMGGPVTVTDKRIIRYFMTIPEACQLVLEAGTMGKGGEIYVFDMGVPIKIYDLAKKMIRLSGYEPDKQIEIKITGLRPGEKLYEELISEAESTLPTHHAKIMTAKVKPRRYEDVKADLDSFRKIFNQLDALGIVQFLKDMIPEYVSNNSPFEDLDHHEDITDKNELKKD